MKRGKDDEKVVEPMFPRLHVNDTEKGGPRAPPRNKMALYEQFSIPSQRFNPASSSNTVSMASSSQVSFLFCSFSCLLIALSVCSINIPAIYDLVLCKFFCCPGFICMFVSWCWRKSCPNSRNQKSVYTS